MNILILQYTTLHEGPEGEGLQELCVTAAVQIGVLIREHLQRAQNGNTSVVTGLNTSDEQSVLSSGLEAFQT